MWCLTRAFPFLFADLVPDDDKFMKLISLLNQIMTIVFAHAVCNSDLHNFSMIVEEHHKLFNEIFAVDAEQENAAAQEEVQDDEQEEAETQEEHGFCDFFPEDDCYVVTSG